MKKLGKAFWVTVGVGIIFFFVLILLSSVLQLGERLTLISPYFAYAFYTVASLLFILLFIRPLFLIIFSPTFSMDSLFDEEQNAKKNYLMYKKVAKNIITEPYLTQEEVASIDSSIGSPLELKQSLSLVFDHKIKKEINKIIVKHAETVFLSTAISQNGRLDSLAVVTINLKLIKELVIKCGFRPSYPALGKLSFNVLTSAVIAEGMEDINLNELFPAKSVNVLGEIPFLKTLTGSFVQGVGNALLTLRVGILARNYLFMNLKGMTKNEIRRMAFAEAVTLLPSVLAESAKKLPSRIRTLFEKVF